MGLVWVELEIQWVVSDGGATCRTATCLCMAVLCALTVDATQKVMLLALFGVQVKVLMSIQCQISTVFRVLHVTSST